MSSNYSENPVELSSLWGGNSVQSHLSKANTFIQQNELPGAAKAFKALVMELKKLPRFRALFLSNPKIKSQILVANRLLNQGNYAKAIKTYTAIIAGLIKGASTSPGEQNGFYVKDLVQISKKSVGGLNAGAIGMGEPNFLQKLASLSKQLEEANAENSKHQATEQAYGQAYDQVLEEKNKANAETTIQLEQLRQDQEIIAAKENELLQLRAEHVQALEQNDANAETVKQLKQAQQLLQDKGNELLELNADHQATIDAQNDANVETVEQLNQAQQNIAVKESKLEHLRIEHTQALEQNDANAETVKQLKQAQQLLQDKGNELLELNADHQATIDAQNDAKEQLKQAQQDIAAKENELLKLRAEHVQALEQNDANAETVKQLKQAQQDIAVKAKELLDLKADHKAAIDAQNDAKEQLKQAQQDIEAKENELLKLNEDQQELARLRVDFARAQKEIEERNSLLIARLHDLEEQDIAVKDLRQSLLTSLQNIAGKDGELLLQDQNLEDSDKEVTRLRNEIGKLNSAICQRRASLDELINSGDDDASHRAIEDEKREIARLMGELNTTQVHYTVAQQQELNQLYERLAAWQQAKQQITDDAIAQKNVALSELEVNHEEHLKAVEEYDRQFAQHVKGLTDLETILQESENARAQNGEQSLADELRRVSLLSNIESEWSIQKQNNNEKIEQLLADLKQSLSTLTSDHTAAFVEQKQAYQQAKINIEMQYAEATNTIETNEQVLLRVRAENDSALTGIAELELKLVQEKQHYLQEVNEAREQEILEQQAKTLKQLENQKKTLATEHDKVINDIARKNIIELNAGTKEANERIKELRQQLNTKHDIALEEQKKLHEQELVEVTKQLEKLNNSKQALQAVKNGLEEKSEQVRADFVSAKQIVESKERVIEKQRVKLRELEEQIKSSTKELEDLNRQNEQLKSDINQQEQKILKQASKNPTDNRKKSVFIDDQAVFVTEEEEESLEVLKRKSFHISSQIDSTTNTLSGLMRKRASSSNDLKAEETAVENLELEAKDALIREKDAELIEVTQKIEALEQNQAAADQRAKELQEKIDNLEQIKNNYQADIARRDRELSALTDELERAKSAILGQNQQLKKHDQTLVRVESLEEELNKANSEISSIAYQKQQLPELEEKNKQIKNLEQKLEEAYNGIESAAEKLLVLESLTNEVKMLREDLLNIDGVTDVEIAKQQLSEILKCNQSFKNNHTKITNILLARFSKSTKFCEANEMDNPTIIGQEYWKAYLELEEFFNNNQDTIDHKKENLFSAVIEAAAKLVVINNKAIKRGMKIMSQDEEPNYLVSRIFVIEENVLEQGKKLFKTDVHSVLEKISKILKCSTDSVDKFNRKIIANCIFVAGDMKLFHKDNNIFNIKEIILNYIEYYNGGIGFELSEMQKDANIVNQRMIQKKNNIVKEKFQNFLEASAKAIVVYNYAVKEKMPTTNPNAKLEIIRIEDDPDYKEYELRQQEAMAQLEKASISEANH